MNEIAWLWNWAPLLMLGYFGWSYLDEVSRGRTRLAAHMPGSERRLLTALLIKKSIWLIVITPLALRPVFDALGSSFYAQIGIFHLLLIGAACIWFLSNWLGPLYPLFRDLTDAEDHVRKLDYQGT